MIDTTGMRPHDAREAASVLEIALELREGLVDKIQSHRDALVQGKTVTDSPLQRLKVEVLARLVILLELHEVGYEAKLKIDPRAATTWAIDQSTIMQAARDLAAIDYGVPVNDNSGDD